MEAYSIFRYKLVGLGLMYSHMNTMKYWQRLELHSCSTAGEYLHGHPAVDNNMMGLFNAKRTFYEWMCNPLAQHSRLFRMHPWRSQVQWVPSVNEGQCWKCCQFLSHPSPNSAPSSATWTTRTGASGATSAPSGRLIALLEEEKQAVVNRAVTRGLDPNVRLKPSGVEWLGDVPEHWEVRRLKTSSCGHEEVTQTARSPLSPS